jgi:hypothetical protein
MVPAQLMSCAVAMSADAGAQFLYLCDQFVSRKAFRIFVHILCTVSFYWLHAHATRRVYSS